MIFVFFINYIRNIFSVVLRRVTNHRRVFWICDLLVCSENSKGETQKSKLAEHIWSAKGDHTPLWNEIKIIDRERFWKERKLKEAAHIILSPTCMSQTSADLNPMWLPLLMKRNN